MDDERYRDTQLKALQTYEGACRRCGYCCGSYGDDPCVNLIKEPGGTFFCAVYDNRLGPQKTVAGNLFTCVNIKDVQRHGIFYENCGYSGHG